MDIYPIHFSKALLNKVPEDERTFHLMAGQLANDLNILSKLIIIFSNPVSGHEILRRANTTSAILLIKLLAGRLNEGWELMCRHFWRANNPTANGDLIMYQSITDTPPISMITRRHNLAKWKSISDRRTTLYGQFVTGQVFMLTQQC